MGERALLPLRVFASPGFGVASAVSLLVGVGMFGALVLIPLYLQIVRGVSPTSAGLLSLPLMLGIIVFAGVSGRIMSRTGRYKAFPVVGTALMGVAALLLSTLHLDTPLWHALAFMVVMGGGLGLCMQMLVIAVQNALPARDMGVATSSVSFFRSLGGTFGAALSLAVLFGTLTTHIRERAVAAGLPGEVLESFGSAAAIDDTSVLTTLPPAVRRVVLEGFADSLDTSFLTIAVVLVPAFLLSLFLREVPLRTTSGLAAERAATAQAEGERVKAETPVV